MDNFLLGQSKLQPFLKTDTQVSKYIDMTLILEKGVDGFTEATAAALVDTLPHFSHEGSLSGNEDDLKRIVSRAFSSPLDTPNISSVKSSLVRDLNTINCTAKFRDVADKIFRSKSLVDIIETLMTQPFYAVGSSFQLTKDYTIQGKKLLGTDVRIEKFSKGKYIVASTSEPSLRFKMTKQQIDQNNPPSTCLFFS
ncbi:MAG: hypothetical protein VW378_07400 [bacterium]